ncbi:hypothetical protein C2E25_10015 [Geothermobacter hydrogeniphilus]|uniref:Uncharacterized protein n=1 Tax=Geothermobacter hydrogeniphilus TaxID=1969733 RepID=A0A2K2H997_9BACT|nr:hypothetical protein [Geothermobacter hydrogeniphilus]PNU19876.1 hypothetical protein C2E25_10015 [Geothermobacter hydrogeniphilus]
MSTAVKIANWVERKPLILICFDEAFSESLLNSRQGFEHLTIVRPHSVFQNFKLPTLCLLEIQDHDGTLCYLGTVTRKTSVSTFDSRLTIKKLRIVTPSSLQGIERKVTDTRMKRLLNGRVPVEGGFSNLSPKLSAHLIEVLARDAGNHTAMDTALSLLPRLRRTPHTNWAQEDAIQSAMAAFGIRANVIPDQVVLKRGASSGLGLIGAHLYEDNVVHADASHIPGFDAIAPDVTGRAVFEKRDERLVIYTANKLPLEKMLGVDLIYINETRGNIVMVQYKMLEEAKQEDGRHDWLFRPDKQFRDEISRMQLPELEGVLTDYRLNRNPFFFKFVKRKIVDDSHQSFLVSLDHLNKILTSPEAKGPKNGIRLSYDALDGTYLRETDMISLIRSGYVGTHRTETQALAMIISEVVKGNKALVLAWQRKIQEGAQ